MTRPRAFWIVSSVLGLAVLPGCLGRLAGARVGPEQNAPAADTSNTPSVSHSTVVSDQEQEYPAIAVSVVPAPSEPGQKPVSIRQTVLENPEPPALQSVPVNSAVSPATARETPPPPVLEDVKAAKLAPASSDPPLLAAFRCILNDEPDKALEHLKGFDSTTQEFLIRLLPALARLGQKPLEQLNAEEVTVLQEQFEELLETLRPFTRLAINRMCCCKWIKGYGNYEPLSEGHLFHAASKPGFRDGEQVKVYVELRNFRCELRDRYHEIRLSSSVEIRDPREPADAKPLWYYRFEDQKEPVRSRAQLHDFFNYYTFSVPHIPPGTYTVTIQVADETTPERHRIATKSQEFRVTAMPMGAP